MNIIKKVYCFALSTLLLTGGLVTPSMAEDKLNVMQEKVLQEWAYSLALQAAIWGSPLVTMYSLRYHLALTPNPKAAPNTIWRMEDISTPALSLEAGYVTPNVNTIYGFGFLDLRQEPVVLQVPDSNNRYYIVEIVDMWTNAFAYVGGKATGYKGGKFAIVAPGWKGDLPQELTRIESPTPWVLVQPRVHLYENGKIDLPGTRAILEKITTTGLAQYLGKPAPAAPQYNFPKPQIADPKLPVSVLEFVDPLQFWEILSAAMNENPPPPEQLKGLLPLFAPLGIKFGEQWSRDKVKRPEVLAVMQKVGANIGKLLPGLPVGTFSHGAFFPSPTIGNFGTDYTTRAVVGRIGLTANTPYEAVYWDYIADASGHTLTGKNKYTITFKEGLPYYEPGFWSITLYDATNNYTITNPINRYMIGSDSKDLKKNPDGSFTIYIQHQSPGKDKESNWLPAPEGPFYLVPRAYAPKPETMELLSNVKAWPVPSVELVK